MLKVWFGGHFFERESRAPTKGSVEDNNGARCDLSATDLIALPSLNPPTPAIITGDLGPIFGLAPIYIIAEGTQPIGHVLFY